ncbi:MAG: endolytic transglycosylase MltG [Chloroflexi bacterium]|nr:endolytic transglycosylase MltG [Chloroflexota bacterium]
MMRALLRALLVLVAGLFVLGTAASVYLALGGAGDAVRTLASGWDGPASDDPTPRRFQVREGQSAAEIGQALEQQGLIRSALVFRTLVRTRGVESKLGRGEYELRATMATGEIVDVLVAGSVARGRRFTIPEGWRAAEVAQRLETQGLVKAEAFLAVVAAPARIAPFHQLVGEPSSLEGYLFPETYEVELNASAEKIAELMVRQFDQQFDAELRRKARAVGLTLHQAVTLASIVEREAAVSQERRLISGVFHNRLKAAMPLQADPTVQYAVANQNPRAAAALGFWKQELQPEDLALPSPFNTYQVKGLPPGPICNPGLASLQAAVDPQPTEYYYFVARQDGSHVFARTLDEHNLNILRLGTPVAGAGGR